MDSTMETIARRAKDADKRYGPYTSTHEAYGVLAEEVAELLDAIRSNDRQIVGSEAVDVAVVAYRLIKQLIERDEAFDNRSNMD